MSQQNNNDFDPRSSIEKLDSILSSREKMGEIIKKVIDKEADVKTAIRKEIVDLIKENKNCREEISNIIKSIDRDFITQQRKAFGSWVGIGIWSLILIVVTAIIQKYIK